MLTTQLWINVTNVQHGLKNIQSLANPAKIYAWSSGSNGGIMAFQEPTAAQLEDITPAAGQHYVLFHTLLLKDVRSQKNLSCLPQKIVLN